MEAFFKEIAGYVALGLEAVAILIIGVGAIQAVVGTLGAVLTHGPQPIGRKKKVWLGFGMWLLLGLEFELGADIVRTAISPTWAEIGQLGAIAVIRTFLNYFLERDLERRAENTETSTA
jgi:uncharacterized membrane protein